MRIFQLKNFPNYLQKNRFWFFIAFLFFCQFLYWFWIRNYTLAYFDKNSASTWFSQTVESLYPRLKIEKYRFEPSFFIAKSDQIAIRFLVVGFVFALFLLPTFYQKAKSFFIRNSVYSQKTTLKSQYFLVIYFLISNVLLSNQWLEILTQYHQIAILYEPISFYKFISPSFPSLSFFQICFTILLINSIIGVSITLILLIKIKQRKIILTYLLLFSSILSSLLFIYLQGFLYGFGKTEHTYASWNWVCILFPFWFYQSPNFRNNFNANLTLSTTPFLPQNYLLFLAIGLIYTVSGLEKLFIGKIEWINGNALLAYLQNSPTDLGQKITAYPFLITLLSIFTIAWESSFLLILHKNKYIRLTLIFIGICFHAGAYFFLSVGHYFSPWIWVYVFLFDYSNEE